MKKLLFYVLAASFAAGGSGCKQKESQTAEAPAQEAAFEETIPAEKFPADLGPSDVDVSKYPKNIQDGHKIFKETCGVCHSPARALNAAYVTDYDWKRFVKRMHFKSENRGVDIALQDAEKIVEFLTYDSKVRKIENKAEFDKQQEQLKASFAELAKKRDRMIAEKTKNMPHKETPYTGVK